MSPFTFTVFAICQVESYMALLKGKGQLPSYSFFHWLWRWQLSLFFGSFQWPTPVRFKGIVFAHKMHSTTKFAVTILSKCVCVSPVCNIWTDVKLLFLQGSVAPLQVYCQRRHLQSVVIPDLISLARRTCTIWVSLSSCQIARYGDSVPDGPL